MPPTISVLLPVYNAETYLESALRSVLDQTFRDFECLVLDDGSRDSSREIIDRLASGDARVKCLSRENRGLVPTLNELVAMAQGKYLARMDADDLARPERFEKQVRYLEDHPEAVCVGGWHGIIDGEGRYLTTLVMPESDDEIQATHLKGHTAICHPTAMLRASAMQQVGQYDEGVLHCEDLDLWLRLGEVGKLANLQERVLDYRIYPDSISGKNWSEQRASAKIACERAWERRGIQGKFEAGEPWRPDGTRSGNSRFFLKYGWWAFESGERRTALHYALRALGQTPSVSAVRLAACALLKRPESQRAS